MTRCLLLKAEHKAILEEWSTTFFFLVKYKTKPALPEHTTLALYDQHSFWFRFENLVIYGPSVFLTRKKWRRGEIFKAVPESLSYSLWNRYEITIFTHKTAQPL